MYKSGLVESIQRVSYVADNDRCLVIVHSLQSKRINASYSRKADMALKDEQFYTNQFTGAKKEKICFRKKLRLDHRGGYYADSPNWILIKTILKMLTSLE